MGHTPGPWQVVRGISGYKRIEQRNGSVPKVLAQVEYVTLQEERDNANLMAAGPDLLAALEATVKELERMADIYAEFLEQDNLDLLDELVNQALPPDGNVVSAAHAAIAKARGT